MNEPAAVTLRPNPRRTTADALEAELLAAGVHVERGALLNDALVVRGLGDPAQLPAVRDGRATPQDQGSQAVVAALAPEPGDRVADLAAAPGRQGHRDRAKRVGDDGSVVALDLDAGPGPADQRRGRRASDSSTSSRSSATRPRRRLAPAAFDRVLLDAPCSGIGVLRRRPDARWQLREESIAELAALQRRLLAAAAALVRPGGVLAVLGLHAHHRGDPRGRPVGGGTPARVRGACSHRPRRGSAGAAARCCSRRQPAPTACTSSRSRRARRDGAAPRQVGMR